MLELVPILSTSVSMLAMICKSATRRLIRQLAAGMMENVTSSGRSSNSWKQRVMPVDGVTIRAVITLLG